MCIQATIYLLLHLNLLLHGKKHIIRFRPRHLLAAWPIANQLNEHELLTRIFFHLGEPVRVVQADSKLSCAQSCAATPGCTSSMWIESNTCNMYTEYQCNHWKVSECPESKSVANELSQSLISEAPSPLRSLYAELTSSRALLPYSSILYNTDVLSANTFVSYNRGA